MSAATELVCLQDFEDFALKYLDKNSADYYRSGADCEQTLRENRDAFQRLRLRPRVLRDVSKRDLSTKILGDDVSFPIALAPSAMQRMAHPDGEIASAKAAASVGTLMTLSSISTTSMEDVAKSSPSGLRWFQLYVYKDRDVTRKLVQRAEKNGYKAIVLTVDAPYMGNRLEDNRNKFVLPSHLRLANFEENDEKSSGLAKKVDDSGLFYYAKYLFDPNVTWNDVEWLKSITTLPIIAKGILTAEDALLALKHGISAILVSNHGARQLDGVPASIEVLPEIVHAVRGRCEVYLDGGVRTGTDVLKALALGAKAVFIGRPVLWGLVQGGESGVKRVLEILRNEFDLALALSGCACLEDIKPSMVVRQEFYSKL